MFPLSSPEYASLFLLHHRATFGKKIRKCCPSGTLRHRQGERAFISFPKSMRLGRLTSGAAAFHDAVRRRAKETSAAKAEERNGETEVTEKFSARGEEIVQVSQALARMPGVSWRALQSTCPTIATVCEAESAIAATTQAAHPSMERLAEEWEKRHFMTPEPPQRNVRYWKPSQCLQQSLCTCRRSSSSLRSFWTRVQRWMRAELPKASLHLQHGSVVLCWRGSIAGSLSMTYIPVMYFKPYRPTLLLVRPCELATLPAQAQAEQLAMVAGPAERRRCRGQSCSLCGPRRQFALLPHTSDFHPDLEPQ